MAREFIEPAEFNGKELLDSILQATVVDFTNIIVHCRI
jgi:hypothetical protein